jgi:oligosaccharide repeat unit polymerase
MDNSIFFYFFLVLFAYIPGLIGLFKFKFYGKFPLILFSFLGMFIFHAAGSILILYKEATQTGIPLFSYQYIIMLIAEVVIFYIITWPYIFLRKDIEFKVDVTVRDNIIIPILILLIVSILFIYRFKVGSFLISDLLSGKINASNVISYRAEKSYGVSYFSFFEWGFISFPMLLASHLLFMGLAKKRFSILNIIVISLCFLPGILLGQKVGVLWTATMLFITYTMYLGINNKPPIKAITMKSAIFVSAAFIPTLFIFFLYMNRTGFREVLKSMIYRIFGVYSETLAAVIPMVQSYGLAYGNTFPLIGSHPGLDARMHNFLYGFEGNAPVPAVGEGYINFGWPGFIFFAGLFFVIIVVLQELLIRFKYGVFSYTIIAWFAYLAIYTNFIGLFATFLSPLNYVVFLLVFMVWCIDYIFRKLAAGRVASDRDIELKIKRFLNENGGVPK